MTEAKPHDRPDQEGPEKPIAVDIGDAGVGREHRGVKKEIADQDQRLRRGTREAGVRNVPPAGQWNEDFPESVRD